MNWDEYSDGKTPHEADIPHFMTTFNQNELSEYESVIVLIYFAFTTLTTVGFGDLTP
jgi:hypothetical protein